MVAERKAAFNAACSGDHRCQQRSKSYAVECSEPLGGEERTLAPYASAGVERPPGGKVILLTKVLLKLVGRAAARSSNEAFWYRMTFSFWSTKESTRIVKK